MRFDAQSIPDLTGKTFVITGANSGIGWWAAKMLADRNARVVLACRDPKKSSEAAARIGRPDLVHEAVLDLASLDSVRRAADDLGARFPRFDVLVNNAGIMGIPPRRTADGFEMQFGTNHLGHFALTGLLLPRVSGRVVTVSSMLHRNGRLDFDNIPEPKRYRPWAAYSASKLANALFGYELDRRLRASGSPVRSIVCHPGYAATNLQYVGPAMEGKAIKGFLMGLGGALLAQSARMGALPTVYAAVAPEAEGGDFIGPKLAGWRGYPARGSSNALSHDAGLAARLWARSEELTGVRYTFA
jgi:NAD(P)-dependent dehydrogenase (short-subunit alcohol dehydrogenase family)